MKVKFTLLTFFVYAFFAVKAQQPAIQNGGFESWNDSVPSFPNGWDSDDDLIHKLSAGIPQKGWCTKDTNPVNVIAGTASCRLRTDTVEVVGQIAPGIVTYGHLGFNGAPYPIPLPFTARPTVFSGSFKFIPNGADTAQYDVYLSKWDATGDSEIIVAYDNKFVLSTDSAFVTFSDTLHYQSQLIPDSIIIAFSSGLLQGNPTAGSILWVDNLAFEYLSIGIQHLDMDDAIKVYPNPVASSLNILVDNYMTGYTFNIYDLTGRLAKAVIIENAHYSLNITDLVDGAYIYEVADKAGKQVHQGKFNIIK
jgi:hypothetical protein